MEASEMKASAKKNGPPTLPSLPGGPHVLNFSPVAENTQTLGQTFGKSKPTVRKGKAGIRRFSNSRGFAGRSASSEKHVCSDRN